MTRSWLLPCVLGGLMAAGAVAQAPSEEAYRFFELNCLACHTIGGGRLVGPDLKGVLERRDRDWLIPFMQDPKGVIDSGDAYGQKLLRDANGVYMQPPPGLTRELAGKLLDVIAAESALEKSRFMGVQISDRPLTVEDVALGRALFRGEVPFESGAPVCFSCHTLSGAGGLGGGRLGPDLTAVYARLEGRKALGAWLSAPPSTVMSPLFRETPLGSDEILALTAYLKSVDEGGADLAQSRVLAFLLLGVGLAAAVLVLLDVIWQHRYRATRRPLVEGRMLAHRLTEGHGP